MTASLVPGYGPGLRCKVDGILTGCPQAFGLMASGAGYFNPGPAAVGIYSRSQQRYIGLAVYKVRAAANGVAFPGAGSLGYLPAGSSYRQGEKIEFPEWFRSAYGAPCITRSARREYKPTRSARHATSFARH